MEYQKTGRTLPGNRGAAMPRWIIALDTETTPERVTASGSRIRHNFRLGCAISAQRRRGKVQAVKILHFDSTADFWSLVARSSGRKHTLWIVATNALFDLVTVGMPGEVSSGRYALDSPRGLRAPVADDPGKPAPNPLVCLESPPFILCLRCVATGGRIVLVDTLNWFKSSVAELGQSVGLAKLAMPAWSAPDAAWRTYCQRDAEITFKTFTGLIDWTQQNDLGVFRFTAASQAMGAFRHRYMPCPIQFHDAEAVKQLERNAFIGGRIECFRLGRINGPVYLLDANSLYPSVMRTGNYPRRLNVYDLGGGNQGLPDIGGWQRCVAEVDIDTDRPLYPLRESGLTVYPIGQFKTTLCGVELAAAVAAGHVTAVYKWAKYKIAPLFTDYVDALWSMRQQYQAEGNVAYDGCCKVLLNSLFGKFAQRPVRWLPCDDRMECLDWRQWGEVDWQTKRLVMHRSIGGHVFKQNQASERTDNMPAISAFIAAAGRVAMNHFRDIAGPGEVYYQGVDGLLVSQTGMDNLTAAGAISDTELGKLRVKQCEDSLTIHGCADYQIGADKIIAGKPSRAVTRADGVEELRKFTAVESLFAGDANPVIYEKIVTWQRTNKYRKGEPLADGWIKPFVLCG